jgi:hypothetical protein
VAQKPEPSKVLPLEQLLEPLLEKVAQKPEPNLLQFLGKSQS